MLHFAHTTTFLRRLLLYPLIVHTLTGLPPKGLDNILKVITFGLNFFDRGGAGLLLTSVRLEWINYSYSVCIYVQTQFRVDMWQS